MLPALAFVPLEDVTASFEVIVSTIQFPPETKSVVDYFEKNYIGRKGIREPTFKQNFWNCYNSVVERLPRTNNSVEGWHNGFNELVRSNPSVWTFIAAIRGENSKNVLLLNQILTGGEPALKKRKYKDIDKKILKIVSAYSTTNIIDYLRAIACNLKH